MCSKAVPTVLLQSFVAVVSVFVLSVFFHGLWPSHLNGIFENDVFPKCIEFDKRKAAVYVEVLIRSRKRRLGHL